MGLILVVILISLLLLGFGSYILIKTNSIEGSVSVNIGKCLTIKFQNGTEITGCAD